MRQISRAVWVVGGEGIILMARFLIHKCRNLDRLNLIIEENYNAPFPGGVAIDEAAPLVEEEES